MPLRPDCRCANGSFFGLPKTRRTSRSRNSNPCLFPFGCGFATLGGQRQVRPESADPFFRLKQAIAAADIYDVGVCHRPGRLLFLTGPFVGLDTFPEAQPVPQSRAPFARRTEKPHFPDEKMTGALQAFVERARAQTFVVSPMEIASRYGCAFGEIAPPEERGSLPSSV